MLCTSLGQPARPKSFVPSKFDLYAHIASPLGAGLPAGFPDLSHMPEGLNELPPGLADFDLSKLQFPGKK